MIQLPDEFSEVVINKLLDISVDNLVKVVIVDKDLNYFLPE